VLLEFLTVYGLWRQEGWERYFLNEKKYNLPSNEEMNEMIIKPMGLDLETEDGRQEFESKVNKLINDNPGMVVPEGEKFNFQFYYAW
jgi:hypothetical protein